MSEAEKIFCSLEVPDSGRRLASRLEVADTFWKRFTGLQLRPGLEAGEAMILVPCASVHTCLMRFPLDLVMLDKNGAVTRVCPGVRPWRAAKAPKGTYAVLELAEGASSAVKPGQRLALKMPPGQPVPPSLRFLTAP